MEAMTDVITEAFFSEKNRELIISICNSHHLSAERVAGVGRSVGYLLLGLIFPKDLPTQIVKEASIDPRIASDIAKEIDYKIILPPLAQELNKIYGFKLDTTEAPPETKQALAQDTLPAEAPPTPQTQPPIQNIKINAQPPTATPFVIHEHAPQGPAQAPTDQQYPGGLVHPSFYAPENTSSNGVGPVARLEIGLDAPQETSTVRIGKESAQVVHYTAPEVAPDPFATTPQTPTQNQPKVNPANVVNLKDLPQ